MKNAVRFATVGVTVGLAATLGAASPATASTSADNIEIASVAMDAVGYDEGVAEANGFKIVTHADGTWESVAVTPEAKAIEATYRSTEDQRPQTEGGGISVDRTTVGGNCGTSWISVRNSGSARLVETGYDVRAPVANRIGWAVQVTSFGGLPLMSFPNGPSPSSWSSWSSYATFSTGGFGGQAYVLASSSVLLIDGTLCGSASPSEGY